MVVSAYTNLFKCLCRAKTQLLFGRFYTIFGSFWRVFGGGVGIDKIAISQPNWTDS